MKWITDNWIIICVMVATFVNVSISYSTFRSKPTEEKIEKFKEWLLYAIMKAEKELGSGTGQFKLRYVYDLALYQFPNLMMFISFDKFSTYVDEMLEKFRNNLESNKALQDYISGGVK